MSKVVQEWIRKADSDWRTAHLIWESSEPNYDAVCFHTQQCVEKMMKALLISREKVPPYTHNLVSLDGFLREVYAEWIAEPEDLQMLTLGATAYRYPGDDATAEDAETCLRIATQLRSLALTLISQA